MLCIKRWVVICVGAFLIACANINTLNTTFYCKVKVEPSVGICRDTEGLITCEEDQGILRAAFLKLNELHIKEVCNF